MKSKLSMEDFIKTYTLPDGWVFSDDNESYLIDELNKELTEGHPLYGKKLRVIADRDGATDDVLVQHCDEPNRFSVVHLTWSGKAESEGLPYIECDGTFDDFLAYENSF